MEEATKSIPSGLFNFIAWILGFSVEPVEESNASISVSETCKVVSIAQDLVYLPLKGKTFTHKSLALAMATRHITGSVKLVKILHGLGHCVSPATPRDRYSSLPESGIVAPGSITGILSGKHYNCCIHAHKLVYEAL